MKFILLCSVFALSLGSVIVQYKFYQNFGKVIQDYSGNEYHGINGEVVDTDDKDTFPTDRGVYFNKEDSQIILAGYSANSLILPSTFTILFWMNIKSIQKDSHRRRLGDSENYIFYRKKDDSSKFSLKVNSQKHLVFEIINGGTSSGSQVSSLEFEKGKVYLEKWQFVSLTIDSTTTQVYLNGVSAIGYNLGNTFTEDIGDAYSSFIGYSTDSHSSIDGFIWDFTIVSSVITQTDYCSIGSSSNQSCLLEKCESTCDPAFVYFSQSYCVSEEKHERKAGDKTNCGNCDYGCTSTPTCLTCGNCLGCELQSDQVVCVLCPSDSTISTTNECVCNDNSLTFNGVSCTIGTCPNIDCSDCSNSNTCASCLDSNADPVVGGSCSCKSGYFTSNLSPLACTQCDNECSTCTEADICVSCIATSALPSGEKGCYCPDGYFSSTSILNSQNSCEICHSDCETCEIADLCITCKVLNANPQETIGCACPENSSIVSNACICNSPYTLDVVNGKCSCPSSTYLNGEACENCSSFCNGCTDYDICIDCSSDLYEKNSTGQCNEKCYSGYYQMLGKCEKCYSLCYECDQNECFSCRENAELVNKNCTCKYGYEGSQSCVRMTFSAALNITTENVITIDLDLPLLEALLIENFEVTIEKNITFTYDFAAVSTQKYTFSIFSTSSIEKSTLVNIKISPENIISISGALLLNYDLTGELYDHIIYISYSSIGAQIIANGTKAATQTVVGSTIITGIMSNPACIWILLNTLEIIAYLPLNSVSYNETLTQFLTSLNGVNLVPNPVSGLIKLENDSIPYTEASNYGFATSVFLINAAPFIINLLIFILLIPFLILGSKMKYSKIGIKCAKLLLNYKYSFFLRFWSQAYLNIGILSLIQLNSDFPTNALNSFSSPIAVVMISIVAFTPALFFIISFHNYSNILNNNHDFHKKWGCFYEEFKNNKGFISTQFYTVFFIRRLFYMFSQVYLNSVNYLQGLSNLLFSLLTFMFLVFYSPFKCKWILSSSIIGEACTAMIMFSVMFLIPSQSETMKSGIENFIIFSVFVTIIIQASISLILALQNLREIWRKIKKFRIIPSLHNLTKITPREDPNPNSIENQNETKEISNFDHPQNSLNQDMKVVDIENQ